MKKLTLAFAIAFLSTPLFAAEKQLTNEQITELLSGSTIKGCLLYTSPSPRDRG